MFWGRPAITIASCGLVLLAVHAVCAEVPVTAKVKDLTAIFQGDGTSVLVKNRQATESDPVRAESVADSEDPEPLEPISQDSDHEPELAASVLPLDAEHGVIAEADYPTDKEAEEFGAALTRAASSANSHRKDRVAQHSKTAVAPPANLMINTKVAKFNGVQPGTSSPTEVRKLWGEPSEVHDLENSEILIYETAPFHRIDVVVTDDTVKMIKVELNELLTAEQLVKQLRLDKFEPASILNDAGEILGQIFPERGVLFMFEETQNTEGSKRLVSHIVIEALDSAAFALRAENHLHGPYEKNIRDLQFALALDSEMAQAHWLLADIYLATGQADLAELSAAEAFNLDPSNDAYRLRWARALEQLARYDDAVRETRAVLDGNDTPTIIQAQALQQMGRLAILGGSAIRSRAIPFQTKAIEMADSVVTSKHVADRRAAKKVLVDAHLAIGREIAGQDYQNKFKTVSKWISRASGLAEDAIKKGDAGLELRLQVAEVALTTLAELNPSVDPAPWIEEAQTAADSLVEEIDDLLWQQHIQWRLGVAYFQAVRIEHTRRKSTDALRYSQKAVDNLIEGAKNRQAVPNFEHLVGRLYFHIGAVYAVHQKDHEKAIRWYDKAIPMLTTKAPVTQLALPHRHGEALVSMGVSYWKVGERSKGLELTQMGADLVEAEVANGLLNKEALAVPYGNLATMYKGMGNESQSAHYADLTQNAKPRQSAAPVSVMQNPNPNTTSRTADSMRRQIADRQGRSSGSGRTQRITQTGDRDGVGGSPNRKMRLSRRQQSRTSGENTRVR
jgi:tetratricopeptide (TPR) repeat protein